MLMVMSCPVKGFVSVIVRAGVATHIRFANAPSFSNRRLIREGFNGFSLGVLFATTNNEFRHPDGAG